MYPPLLYGVGFELRLRCIRAVFFFSSRRRHTRLQGDWSSDVCSSDLLERLFLAAGLEALVVELQHGQNPVEAARAASAHSSIVVAAGGDGTVSSVAGDRESVV